MSDTATFRKALVVVDDRIVLRTIDEVLRGEGYSIVVENDGKEGFRAATTDKIELLVVDINLSGWDGVEMVNSLAIVQDHLPVVVLADPGESPVSIRERINHPSVLGVLIKPFDTSVFRAVVRTAASS